MGSPTDGAEEGSDGFVLLRRDQVGSALAVDYTLSEGGAVVQGTATFAAGQSELTLAVPSSAEAAKYLGLAVVQAPPDGGTASAEEIASGAWRVTVSLVEPADGAYAVGASSADVRIARSDAVDLWAQSEMAKEADAIAALDAEIARLEASKISLGGETTDPADDNQPAATDTPAPTQYSTDRAAWKQYLADLATVAASRPETGTIGGRYEREMLALASDYIDTLGDDDWAQVVADLGTEADLGRDPVAYLEALSGSPALWAAFDASFGDKVGDFGLLADWFAALPASGEGVEADDPRTWGRSDWLKACQSLDAGGDAEGVARLVGDLFAAGQRTLLQAQDDPAAPQPVERPRDEEALRRAIDDLKNGPPARPPRVRPPATWQTFWRDFKAAHKDLLEDENFNDWFHDLPEHGRDKITAYNTLNRTQAQFGTAEWFAKYGEFNAKNDSGAISHLMDQLADTYTNRNDPLPESRPPHPLDDVLRRLYDIAMTKEEKARAERAALARAQEAKVERWNKGVEVIVEKQKEERNADFNKYNDMIQKTIDGKVAAGMMHSRNKNLSNKVVHVVDEGTWFGLLDGTTQAEVDSLHAQMDTNAAIAKRLQTGEMTMGLDGTLSGTGVDAWKLIRRVEDYKFYDTLDTADKFAILLRLSIEKLPASTREMFGGLIEQLQDPKVIALLSGIATIYALSHAGGGIGFIADGALTGIMHALFGAAVLDIGENLYVGMRTGLQARSSKDMDQAATYFSRGLTEIAAASALAKAAKLVKGGKTGAAGDGAGGEAGPGAGGKPVAGEGPGAGAKPATEPTPAEVIEGRLARLTERAEGKSTPANPRGENGGPGGGGSGLQMRPPGTELVPANPPGPNTLQPGAGGKAGVPDQGRVTAALERLKAWAAKRPAEGGADEAPELTGGAGRIRMSAEPPEGPVGGPKPGEGPGRAGGEGPGDPRTGSNGSNPNASTTEPGAVAPVGTPFKPTTPVHVSDAHSVNTITGKTRFGRGNKNSPKTVVKGDVDIAADIAEISAGSATRLPNGDIQISSGRIYGTHPDSPAVYPRSGPGTVNLTQAEFDIFRKMVDSGGLTGDARLALDGMTRAGNGGITSGSEQRLLDLFTSRR